MSDHSKNPIAFAGSTVVSTRKDSAIEGAIVRRRKAADGTRFTTYEIDEGMAEKLLTMSGGLVRRHTAINPDNIASAVALSKTTGRKAAAEQMGVSNGTYRRLLEAGGVETRRYVPVLTDDNVLRALKISVKYNLAKRGDIIRASKEMGVDSRTIRRLLSKALTTMPIEEVGAIRAAEQQRLATDAGQLELEMSKKPIPRKAKNPNADLPDGPEDAGVQVDENSAPVVKDAVARGDDHSAETGLANSPLVPVTPHVVEVADKPGYGPTVIEQPTLIEQPGTSLHEPHGDGDHRTARDAAAAELAASPVVDAAHKPLEMVPPVTPTDALDRTRPNVVSGGTTVEPIGAVSDVDEQKAKGLFHPTRDGVEVKVDTAISEGNVDQFNADQAASQARTDAAQP